MSFSLRTAPDPDAPNAIAPSLHRIWLLGATGLSMAMAPVYTVKYCLYRPPGFPSLRAYLVTRLLRIVSCLCPAIPWPESEESAVTIPTEIVGGQREWDDIISRDVVKVPPVGDEARSQFAVGPECVLPIERPAFVLTPVGALGKSIEQAKEGEKVIYYIHGGGYIRGHPLWTSFPVKIARDTCVRVIAINYRKTVSVTTAFPAPILDALAGWEYVLSLGFAPSSVLVMGDSAGGHLALGLTTQLAALGRDGPGGLALCSPWADFTFSFPSWTWGKDYLSRNKLTGAVRSATRYYTPEAVRGVFFSPALAPKGSWTHLASASVFVSVGTDEAFADEIDTLVAGLRADGVDVSFFKDLHGLHTSPITPWQMPGVYERFAQGVIDVLRDMKTK